MEKQITEFQYQNTNVANQFKQQRPLLTCSHFSFTIQILTMYLR